MKIKFIFVFLAFVFFGCGDGQLFGDVICDTAPSATPMSGMDPLEVAFTEHAQGAVGYLWSFGDLNTSTEENPVHTFQLLDPNIDQQYTVTLRAFGLNESFAACPSVSITVQSSQ